MKQPIRPVTIQPVGKELAIAWNDGRESYLPLEFLRRACPCAVCGGEPDVLGRVVRPNVEYVPESFELRGIEYVGGYGIQPKWGDGHRTGIYSWLYLLRLDEQLRQNP
ncbi:MAG: DUF971 domain-containing protein [Chthoniobacterales bacterium]|nr:DUF971 domain-containing protein [Chthoniobacterales bacterium]